MSNFENDDIILSKSEAAEQAGIITTDKDIEQTIAEFGLLSSNAIPIPSKMGDVFSEWFESHLRALKQTVYPDWECAIKEYTKTGTYDDTLVNNAPQENVIRTTVETLVDYSYMRNPTIELSSDDPEEEKLADALKSVVTNLVTRRSEINLRPKIVRQMIYSHLTNLGTIRLDFNSNDDSRDKAIELFGQLQEQIKSLKDVDELDRWYELLDIVHRELETREEYGLSLKTIQPFNIIVDKDCSSADLSDCIRLAERDWMKISYIKAKYMVKKKDDEGNEQYYFKYKPSVRFDEQKNQPDTVEAAEASLHDFLFPEDSDEIGKLKTVDKLRVVWIYDKPTRLTYVYLEDRWDTPLWVYEDDLKLSRYFRHFIMPFSTPLSHVMQTGEVSHYIGFQNAINEIHKQEQAVRRAAFGLVIYNSAAIDKQEIEKILTESKKSSDQLRAIGVRLRDKDKSLSDALEPFKMPVAQFKEVFEKTGLRKVITEISRISEAMKGSEFKTHTTDDAAQQYAAFAETRIEGTTDRIENTVEELYWSICEIVISKFTQDDVARLTNAVKAADFTPMSVGDFNTKYTMAIAAGSSEKPTSANKKKEALNILQIIGQIGQAAPVTTMKIMIRMLRTAFSRNIILDEDLKQLDQEGQANMSKGVSTQGEQQ